MELEKKVFHAAIKKVGLLDGNTVIEGWASTKDLDRSNEIIEPQAFEDAIKARPVKILLDHTAKVSHLAGKVLSMSIDQVAGFWIKAFLSKAEDVADAVLKVNEGILDSFSVGFMPTGEPEIIDGVKHWKSLELYEVSLVAIPCNRECLFSVTKGWERGSDIVVPWSELVKEVETINKQMALIGAPDAALETVNNSPDGKVAPVTIEPIPEPRYVKFLAELKRANSAAKIEELDEHLKDWKGNNGR